MPTPLAPSSLQTSTARRFRPLRLLGRGVHAVLVVGAVGGIIAVVAPLFRATEPPKRMPVPPTIEDVDWHDPQASVYCLACHRQVARAMAGRDVEQGHPQNVLLNAQQVRAVADMGTITGPNDTLICMSCHKLGQSGDARYMLADTLEGSQLCQRCHPGHYAQGTPHDLRQTAPHEHNRMGQTVATGGPCSACHLAHRYARDFLSTPLDPGGRCITCHQDYRIAAGHARKLMEHPESRCAECHNPHDMSHGEFLKKPVTELCLTCHARYAGGAAAGMHPLGPMETPVPQELIDAGALVGPNPQELTCVVCHAPHQAGHESLLVVEATSNGLCLACHGEKLAGRTTEGVLPRHGQSPGLNAEQHAVVVGWGGRVGSGNELLCVSCHRVHGGEPGAALLAFKLKYGETCVACHPSEATVFGTPHDLQTKFPHEKNNADMSPLGAGACSACHLAHQYPRARAPTAGDPAGQCTSCHRPGQVGQTKLVAGQAHPQTRCGQCHNPHERRYGKFLVKPVSALCAGCHADQARVAGGPHDRTQMAALEKWPVAAQAYVDTCLPCHVPHGGDRADLFRAGGPEPVGNHDDVCLACHPDAAWNAPSKLAAVHPQRIAPDQQKVELALVPTDDAGNPRMGCRTCHNPHGGADPVHLARVAPGVPTQQLCIHCHADKDYIKYTGHAAERLVTFESDIDSCKPCHAMHADPANQWGQMLSPRFLNERCARVGEAGVNCVPCLACHHESGPAPVREVWSHPEMIMMNIVQPGEPGYLPLFNAGGREDVNGQVVCRTCHVSHGRIDLLQRLAANPQMTPEEQHALRMQVRPFQVPNVCTACHGNEARDKFLHFHDLRWRKSQRELGGVPAAGAANSPVGAGGFEPP